jgi:hypothetical protein
MTTNTTPTGNAPVSGKAYGATIGSILLYAVTYVLTAYVPYFHHVIPATLAQLLPLGTGAVGAFAGAWLAKHNLAPAELLAAVQDLEAKYAAIHPLTKTVGFIEHVHATPVTSSVSPGTAFSYSDPTPPELINPVTASGGATPPDSGH